MCSWLFYRGVIWISNHLSAGQLGLFGRLAWDPEGVTGHIVRWWLERWVAKRAEVLERMAAHTLVHSIRHGARVMLPRIDPEQHLLFEEWAD